MKKEKVKIILILLFLVGRVPDVYRRQILTTKVNPRTVRVDAAPSLVHNWTSVCELWFKLIMLSVLISFSTGHSEGGCVITTGQI